MRERAEAVLFLFVLAVLSSAGCSQERRDWREASKANTIQAYEGFLDRNPGSGRSEQALRKIKELMRPFINSRIEGRFSVTCSFDGSGTGRMAGLNLQFRGPDDNTQFIVMPISAVLSDLRVDNTTVSAERVDIAPERPCQVDAIEAGKYFLEKKGGAPGLKREEFDQEFQLLFDGVKQYQSNFTAPFAVSQKNAPLTEEQKGKLGDLLWEVVELIEEAPEFPDGSSVEVLIPVRIKWLPEDAVIAGAKPELVAVPYPVTLSGNLEFTGGLSRVSGNMDPSYFNFTEAPIVSGTLQQLAIGGVPIDLASPEIKDQAVATKTFGPIRIEVPTDVGCRCIPIVLKMKAESFRKLQLEVALLPVPGAKET